MDETDFDDDGSEVEVEASALLGRTVITLPVTLDSANRRKDRSLSIRLSSAQAINTDEYAIIDRIIPANGWFMFSANRLNETDVPARDAPTDGKSPSVRLRNILFVFWKGKGDKSQTFDQFYEGWIERRIDGIKDILD